MAVSYKKLWKLLIDRDMKKKDLCAAAGISHASMAKLGKNFFLNVACYIVRGVIGTNDEMPVGEAVDLLPFFE